MKRRNCGERGEVPERLKGADCKSAGEAFGGSNPPLSTSLRTQIERETAARDAGRACGNSSVGRASAFQAEGRGFKSRFPLQ
jgi:hypothetical protein